MKMYHLVEAESLWALSQRGAVNLPQVKELQDKLRAAGHDPGASDGWYGKKTAAAVRAYQEANGLTVDGDAGPQTLGKLGMGGANNTRPRETPPEETPPAPAPRQPASEPPDEPAPTTRREPEQTTTREPAPTTRREQPATASVRTARPGEHIRVTSQSSGRDIRNAIRNIPDAIFEWEGGSFSTGIISINLKDYIDDNSTGETITAGQNRARQAKNQFLDFLRGDADGFSIYVNDSNGSYIMAYNSQTLDDMPENTTTRREPEQDDNVDDTSFSELVTRISNLDPPATAMYIGTFKDETNATYYFTKVKMSQSNPDVVIYLGGRRSASPAALLKQQGRPRDSFSIYAFSLTKNIGYNIVGRTDHDALEDGLKAFEDAEIQTRSYPLNKGSTQNMRRAHLMRVLKTNPIPDQNESINRLSTLAGL